MDSLLIDSRLLCGWKPEYLSQNVKNPYILLRHSLSLYVPIDYSFTLVIDSRNCKISLQNWNMSNGTSTIKVRNNRIS